MKPAIRKPGKMPYYRIRFAKENVDEERMSVLSLPSTDWFVSLEKDAKRHHYQGWIFLDIPYDTSNNRKAKMFIKDSIPWLPMVKFQNGTWSLTDVDTEKFDDYKTYVAKEKHHWIGMYDKGEMLDRHAQFWAKNKLNKIDRKKREVNNACFLYDKAYEALEELKLSKEEYITEFRGKECVKKIKQDAKINLQNIIEQVVRCNQNLTPVLPTLVLQNVILQLYAKNEDTRDQYRMEECEILSRMFENRIHKN